MAVADDILDVTASTEALGKTAGKDLNMDKTTYPKLMGTFGGLVDRRLRFLHRFTPTNLDRNSPRTHPMYPHDASSGLDGARQEARRLVVEAKAALNPFGAKAASLLAIADYIVEREN